MPSEVYQEYLDNPRDFHLLRAYERKLDELKEAAARRAED